MSAIDLAHDDDDDDVRPLLTYCAGVYVDEECNMLCMT